MPTNYTVCRGDVLSKVMLVQCPFTKEEWGGGEDTSGRTGLGWVSCSARAQEQVSSCRQSESRTVTAARTRGGMGTVAVAVTCPPCRGCPCRDRQSHAEKVLLYMSSKFLVPCNRRRQLDPVAAIC